MMCAQSCTVSVAYQFHANGDATPFWLVLPDTTRTEIATANAAFATATATGTWPYLLLATLWWPAALIGIGIGVTGWVRACSQIGWNV
jgi:hypothetical protein